MIVVVLFLGLSFLCLFLAFQYTSSLVLFSCVSMNVNILNTHAHITFQCHPQKDSLCYTYDNCLDVQITYSVPFSVTAELTSDSGGGQGLY